MKMVDKMKAQIAEEIEKVIEGIFAIITVVIIFYILFLVLLPATCQAFASNGYPNGGFCSVFPTTTSTTTTTVSTTTSSSTSTSTTTIIYKGACIAFSGFTCSDASLSPKGTLTIMLSQTSGTTMYNIQLGCGTTYQISGLPNAKFYNFTQNLTSGRLSLFNLSCSGVNNNTFDGYVWLNYTNFARKPSYNNSYLEAKVASVSIP